MTPTWRSSPSAAPRRRCRRRCSPIRGPAPRRRPPPRRIPLGDALQLEKLRGLVGEGDTVGVVGGGHSGFVIVHYLLERLKQKGAPLRAQTRRARRVVGRARRVRRVGLPWAQGPRRRPGDPAARCRPRAAEWCHRRRGRRRLRAASLVAACVVGRRRGGRRRDLLPRVPARAGPAASGRGRPRARARWARRGHRRTSRPPCGL